MTIALSGAPVLSVVIVSWNAGELLRRCLASLRLAGKRHSREIILVDNASREDVVGMVRREFPEVVVHANAQNSGFAGGNNLGFRLARGQYILLLNPDTELPDPDAIDALVDHLLLNADVAGVGPRLDFPDGRHQVGDAGYAPSAASVASHAFFLSRLVPHRFHGLYVVAPSIVNGRASMPVDWLCGAATLVRRSAIERVGGLDETLFMYAEDIEWGCRMRAHDLVLHYLPAVRIVHVGGSSEQVAAGENISTRWLASLARLFLRARYRGWWMFKASLAGGFLLRSMMYSLIAVVRRSPSHARRAQLLKAYAGAARRLDRHALAD